LLGGDGNFCDAKNRQICLFLFFVADDIILKIGNSKGAFGMKKKIISFVLALVVSVVGFAGMVSASEFSCAPDCCYEDFQPFDLGYKNAD